MKSYRLFWSDGTSEVISGISISDAMQRNNIRDNMLSLLKRVEEI